MRKNVYIDQKCLTTTLVPSVLELYNREVSGYLMGGRGRRKNVNILSAYSFQTDEKKFTHVMHGNLSAVDRVHGVMSALNIQLLGGFHTHPLGPNKLSKSDINFIEEKLDEHDMTEWIEVILNVKKKTYARRHQPGWSLRPFGHKLGLTIKTDPFTGYTIVMSGFWLRRKEEKAEIVQEARLLTAPRFGG